MAVGQYVVEALRPKRYRCLLPTRVLLHLLVILVCRPVLSVSIRTSLTLVLKSKRSLYFRTGWYFCIRVLVQLLCCTRGTYLVLVFTSTRSVLHQVPLQSTYTASSSSMLLFCPRNELHSYLPQSTAASDFSYFGGCRPNSPAL